MKQTISYISEYNSMCFLCVCVRDDMSGCIHNTKKNNHSNQPQYIGYINESTLAELQGFTYLQIKPIPTIEKIQLEENSSSFS